MPVLLGFAGIPKVKLAYHIFINSLKPGPLGPGHSNPIWEGLKPLPNQSQAFRPGFITFAFLGFSLLVGPPFFRYLSTFHAKYFVKAKILSFLVVFMLLMSALAIVLYLAPMFGAFVAGIVARSLGEKGETTREVFAAYSFAIFIPIYFAIVGLRLDLIHNFNLLFFIYLLVLACLIKLVSVFIAALMAGEKPFSAFNLAVAMNAQRSPGIVLAICSKVIFEVKLLSWKIADPPPHRLAVATASEIFR